MTERNESTPGVDDFDVAVKEARPKLKRPPLYRVVLINDDYTPMEFVVEILESIFGMERTRATQVIFRGGGRPPPTRRPSGPKDERDFLPPAIIVGI